MLDVWAAQNAQPYGSGLGRFAAWAFDCGFIAGVEEERAALANLHDTWRERQADALRSALDQGGQASKAREEAERIVKNLAAHEEREREAAKSLQSELSTTLKTLTDEAIAQRAAVNATLETAVSATHARAAELEEYYEKKLQLRSAVLYWGDLKTRQRKLAFGAAAVTVVTGLLLGCYLNYWVDWILTFEETIRIHVLLVMGLGAGLFAWLIRVSVRVFLSGMHLQADADERVTMIQTYLALLKHEQGITDQDKRLMVQTVFRPASSGTFREDGVPPNAWDLLAKAVDKARAG